MAISKPTFYISILGISAMIFIGLLVAGNDLNSRSNISLDNESKNYIGQYADDIGDSNVQNLNEDDKSYEQTAIIQEQNNTGDFTTEDVLGSVTLWGNKLERIENYIKLAYNLPTLFVQALGIDIGEMNHYLNVLGIMLFLGIVIMLIKVWRGS